MFITWSLSGREDPGNEGLCVAAITLFGCCHLVNLDLAFSVRLIYKVRRIRINEEKLSEVLVNTLK